MRFALLLATLIVHAQAFAADRRCNGLPQTGTAGEACMRMESAGQDEQKLDALVRKLQKRYRAEGQAEAAQRLGSAQRAWLEYRAASCEFEQHLYGGAFQISYWRCMDRLTGQRLKALEELQ